LGHIREFTVTLPPLEEQRFIVKEVERRLSVVDKLEATVEANLKQAAGLRQSILKQAFSGELVPQDPDDEPASVLLERIRQGRAASQKPKKRKGKKVEADNVPSLLFELED
jgi:type I restriction enzyme S subunit